MGQDDKIIATARGVVAEKVTGGYRYFLILDNGDRVVLRKKATRLYANAFAYTRNTGPGKGISARFLYGKKPQSYAGEPFRIFVGIPLES